jgi:putative GTP pyrophosphokinase
VLCVSCLAEELYHLKEGPTARTWDDESRTYFKEIGIGTKKSESMYTSVHYVFEKRATKRYTFEIQVRTLAEELWGEVDHAINYPHKVNSVACKEQIKVLARVTSSCTRLVDSIFTSFRDLAPNSALAERAGRKMGPRTSSKKR